MWWGSGITPTMERMDSKTALTGTAVQRQILWNYLWNNDIQVLCKAYSSEYPSFSGKMDKLLHN